MSNNRPSPPKLAVQIIEHLVQSKWVEEVLGDLEEKFYTTLESKSLFLTRLNYWYQVFNYLRPFAWRKMSNNSIYTTMLKNYFKVAWQNLLKHRMYSGIKIGGFAIGVAAFLLIAMFVADELNYDQHYQNKDRIYRLLNVYSDPGNSGMGTAFPAQTTQIIKDNFPEVEKAGRLIPYDWFDATKNQVRRSDRIQNSYEESFAYADQVLLDILEIPMIYGDQATALAQPKSVVISKNKADKYFPGEDPVGKTLILNEDKDKIYVIGGVMPDFSAQTHLNFDFLLTLTGEEFWPGEQTDWCCWNYNPYLLLREGTDPRMLEEKLLLIRDDFILKYQEEQGNPGVEDTKKYFSLALQPITDVHLYSEGIGDIIPHGDIRIAWLFSAIALFILLLAAINFINLSTAKSANRAKEVGLRKVVGSFKGHLIQQFLTESVLYSAISVLLGVILAFILLPYFNALSGKSLSLSLTSWWLIPMILTFILAIGLLSGLYPAFYLSAFKPIDVLKGSLSRGSKSSKIRGAMVVFQFTTSIVLIVGAFMIHRQMQYILNKRLGFDKDQVLLVQGTNTLEDRLDVFKNELVSLKNINHATHTNYLPVSGTKRDQNLFWKQGRNKIDKAVSAQLWSVDEDFLETLDIKLVEGRNFTDMASDSSAIIINESMAKAMNLENPVGAKIMNFFNWKVIGVIEDFHFENMKENIKPLSLMRRNFGSVLAVKIEGDNMSATIDQVKHKWDEFMPKQPFRYTFLDVAFTRMYEDVQRTGSVFTAFAVLAIIVACLGLFGLSAFMIEQRSKEISIRKVLGASMLGIFKLMTFNFTRLVLVSFLLATPIAWYLVDQWLGDFQYRTTIDPLIFMISGLLAVAIALVTISYESIKAGRVNPAQGLRSE
ncbi:MAG: ABC transporter permease [Cyclobacteriaceae bacterium]|nr:ABC transporter permease [Cyclobacteriaceae bacterium HetDA_MAG_MS6]